MATSRERRRSRKRGGEGKQEQQQEEEGGRPCCPAGRRERRAGGGRRRRGRGRGGRLRRHDRGEGARGGRRPWGGREGWRRLVDSRSLFENPCSPTTPPCSCVIARGTALTCARALYLISATSALRRLAGESPLGEHSPRRHRPRGRHAASQPSSRSSAELAARADAGAANSMIASSLRLQRGAARARSTSLGLLRDKGRLAAQGRRRAARGRRALPGHVLRREERARAARAALRRRRNECRRERRRKRGPR